MKNKRNKTRVSAWLAAILLAAAVPGARATDQSAATASRPAKHKFIRTFLLYQSHGPTLTAGDVEKLAKFDILCLSRFRYNEIGGDTYAAVRKLNPDIQIYIYQHGPDVWQNMDDIDVSRVNNIVRYNNARGHSMGNLNRDNPDLFLATADGKRCHTYNKPYRYLMDFGNPKFHKYWLEATSTDILERPWAADGVFIDNTSAMMFGYECDTPAKYDSDDKWIPAMHKFQVAVSAGLHERGQKVWTNTCCSVKPRGYAEWLALDGEPDGPDLLGEEGAYSHGWGGNKFYPEEKWKRQVDVLMKLKRCSAMMFCHTSLKEGQSGIDQYGKPVTYWQTLWYALGSYLLGKNDKLDNAYFYFFTQATGFSRIYWYDEYERIDLGRAQGPYHVTNLDGTNIYWRRFQRGYVYVNPTTNDVASVALPRKCRQLTHEKILDDPATLPVVETIELKAHHAAILLDADR